MSAALPRATTREIVLQVQHNGVWHRRTPDLDETACGVPFHSQFCALRRETLHGSGSLCTTCFTAHELAIAANNRQSERDRADE